MNIVLKVLLIVPVLFAIYTTDSMVLEHHGFRQSQTMLQTLYIDHSTNFIDFILPVFGPPWMVPMEYPLYQIIINVISNHTTIDPVYIAALVSMLSLYTVAYFVSKLIADSKKKYIGIVITSPVLLYYSNKYLIDLFAVALSIIAFVYFHKSITNQQEKNKWIMSIFLALTGLQKITVLIPLGFGILTNLWLNNKNLKSFISKKNLHFLLLLILPIAIALSWVYYSDNIKLNNYLTSFLTSSEMRGDNFGTVSYRLNLANQSEFFGKLILLTGIFPVIVLLFFKIIRISLDNLSVSLFVIGLSSAFIFFKLHVVHDYYYIMSSVYMMAGALRSIEINSKNPGNIVLVVAFINLVTMQFLYSDRYTGIAQSHINFLESARYINKTTNDSDIILSMGADWDSTLPLYSNRKFIMIPEWSKLRGAHEYVEEIIKTINLKDIGAILLCDSRINKEHKAKMYRFIERIKDRVERFGTCNVFNKPDAKDINNFLSILK